MLCRKCGHELCWVCMCNWSEHRDSWRCNLFTLAADGANTSRSAMERYLHYYNRFRNHMQPAKLDEKLVADVRAHLQGVQEDGPLGWTELELLRCAAPVAALCRQTLKWAYAMGVLRRARRTGRDFFFERTASATLSARG